MEVPGVQGPAAHQCVATDKCLAWSLATTGMCCRTTGAHRLAMSSVGMNARAGGMAAAVHGVGMVYWLVWRSATTSIPWMGMDATRDVMWRRATYAPTCRAILRCARGGPETRSVGMVRCWALRWTCRCFVMTGTRLRATGALGFARWSVDSPAAVETRLTQTRARRRAVTGCGSG